MRNYPKIARGKLSLRVAEVSVDCDRCLGLGSVLEREGGYDVARSCGTCGEKRKHHERFNLMGLPNVCDGMTFSSFLPQDKSQQTAIDVCRAFTLAAKQPGGAQKGVAVLGPPGVGKTHLLSAVGHYLTLACGLSVRWARFE